MIPVLKLKDADGNVIPVPAIQGEKGDPGNTASVNSVEPDAAGNISLTSDDIPYGETEQSVTEAIDSRQSRITASGLLKGDGAGGISAATAGTDYVTPTQLNLKQDKSTLMTQALTLQPGFEVYNAQEGNTLLVRKYGAVVELVGSITLSESNPAQIGGATSILMTQIPASYRPKVNVYFVQQGSGAAKWFLEVHTDGNVYAYRHSTGDTYSNPTPGSWLPVYANFLCE